MSNYWVDRVNRQNNINFNRSAAATDKKLAELYKKTGEQIAKDIKKLYANLDVPEDEIRINDLYKNNQFYELLGKINKQLTKLGEDEIKINNKTLLGMYNKTSKMVSNQAGFSVGFEDGAQAAIDKIWCPDGKHWSSRVWKNKSVMQAQLEQGITDCVARGLSKEKIITEITEKVDKDRYKASRLVRTELTYVQNAAAADTYEKAGCKKYEYCAALDNRTSEECKKLNGQQFYFAEAVVGENFPPMHANCRCTIVPVFDDEEDAPLGSGSEGNSVGKAEKIDEIDVSKTDNKIKEYSELIRYEKAENSYIIDRYGNVFYSKGDDSNVYIENIDLKGATITHNHPDDVDVLSFGKDDFDFLKRHGDIRRLIAVNSEYTYEVKILKSIKELDYNDYYVKALSQVGVLEGDTVEFQHEVFELLNKEGYVKYERKKYNKSRT